MDSLCLREFNRFNQLQLPRKEISHKDPEEQEEEDAAAREEKCMNDPLK